MFFVVVFFFKQKTAYEMRISDWSSDVCSSDLRKPPPESTRPTFCDRPHSFLKLKAIWQHYEFWYKNGAFSLILFPCSENTTSENKIGSASCRERVCQYV